MVSTNFKVTRKPQHKLTPPVAPLTASVNIVGLEGGQPGNGVVWFQIRVSVAVWCGNPYHNILILPSPRMSIINAPLEHKRVFLASLKSWLGRDVRSTCKMYFLSLDT